MITWRERVANLKKSLGRKPTLDELLMASHFHVMTPAERREQQESWVRGMTTGCEHGVLDFETCPDCRGWR